MLDQNLEKLMEGEQELESLGFPDDSLEERDPNIDPYALRKEWIEAHGVHIWQVYEDERGEYVCQTLSGDADGNISSRVYLPEHLTKAVIFKRR